MESIRIIVSKVCDRLSECVDVVDRFVETEIQFFKSRAPYFGRHRKRIIKTDEDKVEVEVESINVDPCHGCYAPSYDPRDCEICERRRNEK